MHLGRRTQKYSELAVILENGRGVDEADVAESGAGQLLGKALPVKSVMSVEVDLVGVEGAVGIFVEVRDQQPTTVHQEPRHGPQQSIQVLHVVQRHGAPHHVVGPIEPVCRQVCLNSAQAVTEPGRLDPLPCDLHHSGGGVGHDNGADQVGKQDAQATGATANVNGAHPRAEVHGLLDGLGHRQLPLLVAGVVVPRGCLVVESLVFVHVLDPSPVVARRGGRTETVPGHSLRALPPEGDPGWGRSLLRGWLGRTRRMATMTASSHSAHRDHGARPATASMSTGAQADVRHKTDARPWRTPAR